MKVTTLTTGALVEKLETANNAYRNTGASLIDDTAYDQMIAELATRNPSHPFLNSVEKEADFGIGKVRHSRPMLSTSKTYTDSDLSKWCKRIEEAAVSLGLPTPVEIKLTAKLDGMAGRLENGVLASRGDGLTGNDLTHMIDKGLVVSGDGDGEIVIPQDYFDEKLAKNFKHPRNVVTGIVASDNIRDEGLETLADSALHFASYKTLAFETANTSNIVELLPELREKIIADCPYPTDGIILQIDNLDIRDELGSTSHHHSWMMAAKTVDETAEVVVTGINWQVGRSGRLTPVIRVEPTELSGAVISNVTGHHANNIKSSGIDTGAVIEIVRSGLVIPKVLNTITPVDVKLPTNCPCCDTDLKMKGDFLVCHNLACHDRARARLNHFFEILGTIDLFGKVACDKIVKAGYTNIKDVFRLTASEYEAMGFGAGQADNLVSELESSKTRAIDDFKILAAFGISKLGRGDSKKILKLHNLSTVHSLTADQLISISGFGELTSESITTALPEIKDDLLFLCDHFENIIHTGTAVEVIESAITGKRIVFTGSMESGKRPDMIKHAESLGAISQSSVNKVTDILVAGGKVGESKIEKAKKHGTKVISEAEYLDLIS